MKQIGTVGYFIVVEKTCRKERKCFKCGKIIPEKTKLIAVQSLVVFRKKYYKDIGWCCEKHGIPKKSEIKDDWIWGHYP